MSKEKTQRQETKEAKLQKALRENLLRRKSASKAGDYTDKKKKSD